MTHVLMTGGGTLGPVTPLLAVAAEWRRQDPGLQVSWVGTHRGPERQLIEAEKYQFFSLSVPKFDRHRKWKLIIAPFVLVYSCWRAWQLLSELKPNLIMSAGAYVSVPVVWMAWIKRIPVWIHQLDVLPGLANKLMAPFAKKISVTWSESATKFAVKKTSVVGAMARQFVRVGDARLARERFKLSAELPTVLVIGGGTGSANINEAMAAIGKDLSQITNVIHVTGHGKMLKELQSLADNYIAVEFLQTVLADAYALADVVVARAGMGTIAELAVIGKATILVPLPDSHQLANTRAVTKREAAVVLEMFTPQTLFQAIDNLLKSAEKRQRLAVNIRSLFPVEAEKTIVAGVKGLLNS
jgi:UDP-N-acetylglucosamine--N-acetylmuramyl-(pentapeptide) pyrophosphoryl-undecaprenol N-acetylglucosamine transferase